MNYLQNQLKPNYDQKIRYTNKPIKTSGHFEQVDVARKHSEKIAKDESIVDKKATEEIVEDFYENETDIDENTELWNDGRKIVHKFSNLIAYKLNVYNDKATKWMVKQGEQYVACVRTIDDVLNVFQTQFA